MKIYVFKICGTNIGDIEIKEHNLHANVNKMGCLLLCVCLQLTTCKNTTHCPSHYTVHYRVYYEADQQLRK